MRPAQIEILMMGILLGISCITGAFAIYLARLRRRSTAEEPEWTGTGFDATQLAPRIAHVRENYVEALRSQPHPLLHGRFFLARARHSVRRLAFFQGHSPNENALSQEISGRTV